MRNSQLQTPQRDQTPANRRLTTPSDLNGNARKGVRKSLNPQFKADSKDDTSILESLKESTEASDESPISEIAENFSASDPPSETHSSEAIDVSHLTSIALSSVTTTPNKHAAFDMASNHEIHSLEMTGSVEAELVIKHLKEARLQVFESKDLGSSKKLVEALINITIDELHGGLYEKNEWLDQLLSRRFTLGFLISILGISYMFIVWFLKWSSKGSFSGLTPT